MRTALAFCCLLALPKLGIADATRSPAEGSKAQTTEKSQPIEEMIITVSPRGRSADELVAPITVVRRDDILNAPGATLGELLERRAGITTSAFASGASRPVIRGQDAFRVQVLENGIGVADVSALSPDHGVPVNPVTTQRLEVVRGPATLRYGGGAIAGVVNALTERVPVTLPDRPFRGELYTAYGLDARERDLAGVFTGAAGAFAWHADGFTRDSDDYDIPGSPGEQAFTDTDGYGVSLGGAWLSESVRIGGSITRTANLYGIPAPEDPEAPLAIDLEQDHYALEADWIAPMAGVEAVRLRGVVSEYLHDEVESGSVVNSSFDNEEAEIRAELLHAPIGRFAGAVGVQMRDRDLSAGGEGNELLPPSETRSAALFLFESMSLGDTADLELAARWERTSVDGTDPSGVSRTRRFVPLSASARLGTELSERTRIALTLSAAQRAPDVAELFSQGPHDATETFEIGDPNHDEETSYTADVTLRNTVGPAQVDASVFYTSYESFTFGALTGRSRDEDGTVFEDPDEGELAELFFLQEDATFLGGELEVRAPLVKLGRGMLGIDAQADFVRARLRSSGDVPRIPPRRYGAGLFYEGERIDARIGFIRASAQTDLARLETRTSGYTLVDATLRARLLGPAGAGGRSVDVVISAQNLLDARARNHVSFKKEDVLLRGRSIRIGIHTRF
jgi:iron complex outermembrane receptor protein